MATTDPSVLVVLAVADRPDSDQQWYAEVTDPASPFVGLFAWGRTVSAAREGLAKNVWAALVGEADDYGPAGLDVKRISAVRILVTTRKTFSAARLSRSLAQAS